MKTVIYINNDTLQIACEKKGKVTTIVEPLERGTVVNGVITNMDALVEALKNRKKILKRATLVITCTNIMVKRLVLPKVPRKHIPRLVGGEFEMMSDNVNVYDGAVLQSGRKSNTLLGVALQRDIVASYVKAFRLAGIKLGKMDFLVNSMVKYVSQTPKFHKETFVLNLVIGGYMLSVLFVEGAYHMVNRIRLFNDPGTSMFTQELFEKLSSMIQFAHAQNVDTAINRSYYIGLEQEDLRDLMEMFSGSGVEIASYRAPDVVDEACCACFGLTTVKRDINLVEALKLVEKKPSGPPAFLWQGLICLALAGGMIASWYHIDQTNQTLDARLEPQRQFVVETLEQAETVNLSDVSEERRETMALIEEYEGVLADIAHGDHLTAPMIAAIGALENVTGYAYDGESSTLIVSGETDTMEKTVEYVAMLRSAGLFQEVYLLSNTELEPEEEEDPIIYSYSVLIQLEGGESLE